MREIKFRGKDKRMGVWVYGYYVGENTLIPTDEVVYDIGYICDSKCNECIPDTLGQYTGLKDKNGKEIYEGDIVKGYEIHRTPDCATTDPEPFKFYCYFIKEVTYRIKWDGYSAMFDMVDIENDSSERPMFFFEDYREKWEEIGCSEDDIENRDAYPDVMPKDIYSYEVIGNIYDNPELGSYDRDN